ncbi:MAG: SDR family oxidoreductase [Candidatus Zixiibacteriota bacterium]
MIAGKLAGKTALITGAGRGIGRATAVLFADQGASVVIISRTQSELEATAVLCAERGNNELAMMVDVSKVSEVDLLFENIAEQFPRVDILINNAALFDSGLMAEYPIDRLETMLRTNLLAPCYLAQKMIASVDPAIGGTIVNVSSYSGCVGVEKFPGFGAYNITKYALWGLTEILALENKHNNIRVNQVSLSGVDTKMFREAVPPGTEAELSADEVAEKILYLASEDSAPLTGQNIMLPGSGQM